MTDNISIVSRTYACGKAGDMAGFVRDFSDDITWTEMKGAPYAGTYVGAKAIVTHVFEPMNRDWAPFACKPEQFLAQGDAVVMVGLYFGKNAATGKNFEARVVHVWKVQDGKVTSFEQFTDTKLIADAML